MNEALPTGGSIGRSGWSSSSARSGRSIFYSTLAVQCWHRRLACCYGLAACLAFGFGVLHVPAPLSVAVAAWA